MNQRASLPTSACEVIYEFEVTAFPVTVAVDRAGNNIHTPTPRVWGKKIGEERLLEGGNNTVRYLDFLFGQTVNFAVAERASPQQVTERLRPEVRSRFWPFHFDKVVGRVGADTLSLEWRGGIFGTNMAPRLRGRLVFGGSSTHFEGKFGAPVSLRFFLAMWVCFDAMFFVLALSGNLEGGDAPTWVVFPFLTVHLIVPFGITALGMIGADDIRQRLTDFIIDVGSGQSRGRADAKAGAKR